jgi:hypothetical protein
MFPFTKKQPPKDLVVPADNLAKKSIKTMDTLVTGMILGGIIASIYGVKKLKEKKENHGENTHTTTHH